MSEDEFAGIEPPGGVNYGEWKFQVRRHVLKVLAEAVSPAVPCGGSSLGVESLGCFRVRCAGGSLSVAATDMERTVFAASDAVLVEGVTPGAYGEVFLPASKLQAILKEAPDTDVSVSVVRDKAHVRAGTGQWSLSLPDSSDYPDLVQPQELDWKPYLRQELLAALKTVKHAVCRDPSQPLLTQVDVKAGGSVTASDGARFARARVAAFPEDMCIPSSALDDLVRMLGRAQVEEVSVAVSHPVFLAFRCDSTVLAVRRRSTPFPDMDAQLLEPVRENDETLSVDRDELAAAVRRVRVNADDKTAAIVLEATEGALDVVSRDKAGNSAREPLAAGWEGARRIVCVNHVFLADMLAVHPDKGCVFRLGRDVRARRSMVLLEAESLVQVITQMPPALVGYK